MIEWRVIYIKLYIIIYIWKKGKKHCSECRIVEGVQVET